MPEMTPEEHQRRGDAADALFRELVRRATGPEPTPSSGQEVTNVDDPSSSAAKRGSIWRPGAAYAIVRDDAEIGRIDVNGTPERDGAGRISLREHSFECRIHRTGKKRWTYVPARWVMYSGDTALHGATCESNTSFLTEDEAGQEPIRLRRHFSGPSTLEARPISGGLAKSER